MKIDWFASEKYFFTDSISENLTDSDLESGKADDRVIVSLPVIVILLLKFDKVLKNNFN